jgi:hypothetical protein
LIANLYLATKTSPDLVLGINLNKNWYTENRASLPSWFTYAPVKRAFDYLTDETVGLAKVVKPGNIDRTTGKGFNTKIVATRKLIDLIESQGKPPLYAFRREHPFGGIILKDAKKKVTPYKNTAATKAMRGRLARINAVLLEHWADLEITDNEFDALQSKFATAQTKPGFVEDERLPIDFTQRTLYRVFNNRSFDQGGRFYGGWWQSVPSRLRRFITINDKRTVELDFSTLHPRMIYAHAGVTCPDDPYDVGLAPDLRPLVKHALNALINAQSSKISVPGSYDPNVVGMSWKAFLLQVKKAHEPIKHLFGTGIGLALQRKDSDVAEAVMLNFAQHHIPCLPIHDSFIMHHGYEDELNEVMDKTFFGITGSHTGIKVEKMKLEDHQAQIDILQAYQTGEDEIQAIINSFTPYRQYHQRIDTWRNRFQIPESVLP